VTLRQDRAYRRANAADASGQCEPLCLSVPAGRLQPWRFDICSPTASCGALPLATEPSFPPGATTIYVGGQNGADDTGQVVASHDAAAQAVRAVDNVETVLRAAGATLADVVAWTVLIAADADVAAAYGAIAPRLARAGAPPLVTAARVAGLAVPGALLEISAIAAVAAD